MFKIMKGIDKISADEFFNRVDSDRTRGHNLRVKKRRVKMVVRSGSFTQSSYCMEWSPWKVSGSRNSTSV